MSKLTIKVAKISLSSLNELLRRGYMVIVTAIACSKAPRTVVRASKVGEARDRAGKPLKAAIERARHMCNRQHCAARDEFGV